MNDIDKLARKIAAQYGLDPDAKVWFGEPEYVYLPGKVLAYYLPADDDTSPIWHSFRVIAEEALAMTHKLPPRD